jgi:hypothetical protein
MNWCMNFSSLDKSSLRREGFHLLQISLPRGQASFRTRSRQGVSKKASDTPPTSSDGRQLPKPRDTCLKKLIKVRFFKLTSCGLDPKLVSWP